MSNSSIRHGFFIISFCPWGPVETGRGTFWTGKTFLDYVSGCQNVLLGLPVEKSISCFGRNGVGPPGTVSAEGLGIRSPGLRSGQWDRLWRGSPGAPGRLLGVGSGSDRLGQQYNRRRLRRVKVFIRCIIFRHLSYPSLLRKIFSSSYRFPSFISNLVFKTKNLVLLLTSQSFLWQDSSSQTTRFVISGWPLRVVGWGGSPCSKESWLPASDLQGFQKSNTTGRTKSTILQKILFFFTLYHYQCHWLSQK